MSVHPRFDLPEGVTTGLGLVTLFRTWEGARGAISEGAVALADWIVADPVRAGIVFSDPLCRLHDRLFNRVLADIVAPGDELAEWLGHATDGAVTKRMFQRDYAGEPAEPDYSTDAPAEPPSIAEQIALLAAIPGRLGQVPVGPLFTSVRDPLSPDAFVLVGMGMALSIDAPIGRAMIAAIRDGLGEMEARG